MLHCRSFSTTGRHFWPLGCHLARIILRISTFRSTSTNCSGPFVVPPLCLPSRRRKKKRGPRAGVLVRTRKRCFKPAFPTILLANVQSIDNKMDELNAPVKFQRDIRNCCVLGFFETWLSPRSQTRRLHCQDSTYTARTGQQIQASAGAEGSVL